MLTPRMKALLDFIIDHTADTGGVPPTYDEMVKATDLRSKAGVSRMLDALEERGFIRRMYRRRQSIEVIKNPGEVAEPVSEKLIWALERIERSIECGEFQAALFIARDAIDEARGVSAGKRAADAVRKVFDHVEGGAP